MRILLTGVNGQVGGALRSPLQAFGTVLEADRQTLDLSRTGAISGVLDRLAPDLIVNPAAYTAVDRAEDERELAYRINADAVAQIAAWSAGRRVPLVHFSTDYVFDGSGERPWHEDDPTNPLSVYGASKLAGETAIRAAGGPHLIVRTSWVYAARGTNFLRTIAKLAQTRKELRIVADQIGAPTSARAIADVVCAIIRGNSADLPRAFARCSGIVHVACAGETSWHGFATDIVRGLQQRDVRLEVENVVPIGTSDYPTKAARPKNSRLDLTRLRDVFGVTTPHWRDALATELDELARELAAATTAG